MSAFGPVWAAQWLDLLDAGKLEELRDALEEQAYPFDDTKAGNKEARVS